MFEGGGRVLMWYYGRRRIEVDVHHFVLVSLIVIFQVK